jgi:hypothetical protein
MATYDELLQASENEVLLRKIRVAIVIAAETIRNELSSVPQNAKRLVWAKKAFTDPQAILEPLTWAVLAQNKNATFLQIIGATDSVVQSAVDAAVNVLLD